MQNLGPHFDIIDQNMLFYKHSGLCAVSLEALPLPACISFLKSSAQNSNSLDKEWLFKESLELEALEDVY